jgi:hypothetical protein
MSGSIFARPEFIEGCAPFKSLKLTESVPTVPIVPAIQVGKLVAQEIVKER